MASAVSTPPCLDSQELYEKEDDEEEDFFEYIEISHILEAGPALLDNPELFAIPESPEPEICSSEEEVEEVAEEFKQQ